MEPLPARAKRVVVVDDDRDTAELVQTILLDEGFAVSCLYLGDPAEVRAAIDRIEPDCVLLDGGDLRHVAATWETATWLVDRPRPIPTVLLTGHPPTRDEAVVDRSDRAKAARVVGVIAKPFDIDLLVAAVHNAVGEPVRPSTDAEELDHQAQLLGRLRAAGAAELTGSELGRVWATFRAGDPASTFKVYRWRAAGAYFVGRYRSGGAQMEPLGQFTDLDALVAYCTRQIERTPPAG
ncbi:MAG TPA: response regulator [Candidatus Limnocylindria bacterium]|nr:response regulator [Candidatus Limnocylindria bacterium]